MTVILWMVFGAIVGWAASVLTATSAQKQIIENIVLGVLGALLGGWLITFFGPQAIVKFDFTGFIVAIVGAVALIWIARGYKRPLTGV